MGPKSHCGKFGIRTFRLRRSGGPYIPSRRRYVQNRRIRCAPMNGEIRICYIYELPVMRLVKLVRTIGAEA
jgi:hypothetical protein